MVDLPEVLEAGKRLQGIVHRTPVFSSATFAAWTGKKVWLKAENLQKTGAFKFRGASNFLARRQMGGSQGGVITPSSGNHGQAVALAAAQRGVDCTVVVPETASPAKVAAIQGYGANVIYWGTVSAERIEKARELAEEQDLLFVHSFDDPDIIAGQGTAGLELIEQVPDLEAVCVPVGGGGLISGMALAIKEQKPGIRVLGVEPRQSNSMQLSLAAGAPTTLDRPETLADGLRTSRPGEHTFPLVQRYVDDIVLVEEEEIEAALRHLLERGKLLVEPSGAVALAAVLAGKLPSGAGEVGVVLSGGNVEMGQLGRLLQHQAEG